MNSDNFRRLTIMKIFIRGALLGGMLLTCSAAFAQVSIGIQIGPPTPPRVVHVVEVRPAPEYVWVEGYWYPVGQKYKWHQGYWTRPPYEGARWIAPRYEGREYFVGYWQSERGRFEH